MLKIDMLNTSIGSCTRRRRNISRPLDVRLRRSRSIFVFEFIRSPWLISVVEPEKGEKADENPEHRTENSEPKGDIPICASDDRDFARKCFCKSCHQIYCFMVSTTRNRTLPLCICS